MRSSICVLIWLIASHANAATSQRWHFLYVARGSYLNYSAGDADLNRDGNKLFGSIGTPLTQFMEPESVTVDISDDSASGVLHNLPVTGKSISMKGTYWRNVTSSGECWETIQLYDGLNFITLARSYFPGKGTACEP